MQLLFNHLNNTAPQLRKSCCGLTHLTQLPPQGHTQQPPQGFVRLSKPRKGSLCKPRKGSLIPTPVHNTLLQTQFICLKPDNAVAHACTPSFPGPCPTHHNAGNASASIRLDDRGFSKRSPRLGSYSAPRQLLLSAIHNLCSYGEKPGPTPPRNFAARCCYSLGHPSAS
jgi:hypothetical protein